MTLNSDSRSAADLMLSLSVTRCDADQPEENHDARKGEKSTDAAKPKRILLVEDELLVARENEDILAEAGYDIVGVAADEARALWLAEKERPDLVLMDIRLAQNSDGIELAKALRARMGVPCLMVTAFGDSLARARAAPANPRGWLIKPFTELELLQAVRLALGRSD
jgi:DNA-binding response OmpR family regulator